MVSEAKRKHRSSGTGVTAAFQKIVRAEENNSGKAAAAAGSQSDMGKHFG